MSYSRMFPSLYFAFALASYAQPQFEVATVKRSPPPEGDRININLGGLRNGTLTFGNASLSDCLKFAYNLVSDSQLSGPDWIKSKDVRFDIVAKVPPDTPRGQMLMMLQALLGERLKVAAHFEKRDLAHLELVVSKNGPKLREVKPDPGAVNRVSVPGRIAGSQISMQTLALLISRFERQTVIDRTGLAGVYALKLEWTPDLNRPPSDADAPPPGPSIFTAVQEQLGLKLDSRKSQVDVLVVDHAEQVPAEN